MAFTLVAASCVGEVADPADNAAMLGGNVAAVTEQVASVNNSLELLNSLDEVVEYDFSAVQADMENHVRYLMSGVSSVDATIASLQLQKNVAAVVGELQVEGYESLSGPFAKSLKSWIGDDFVTFFDVAVYRGKVHAVAETATLRFTDQYDFIDAVRSDVEAGLREGVGVKELSSTAEDIQNNISLTEEIAANADAVLESLEVECTVAIESMLGNSKDYNPESLKKANAQASAQLKSAESSIADLAASIEAMQEKVDGIDSRLSGLEEDVEGLLGMIQSVTFLSEYSEDYAVAYYEMNDSKVSAPGKTYDGKNQRDPAGTIELSYMVRPASTATAVTSDVVSVVGYYANQLQTKAIDPSQFVNFEVQGVRLTNAERGIVTVTLSHDLKDDFYYKTTGAKCALFIATGKTDVSSKFVELIPKDNSTTVYVEGLKINTDDFEIDEGQTKNLTATVNPSSATNKTLTWTSSNTEIATVDKSSGVLTAVKQGNVTITATTNGIDEWGDNLTASVNVKVNPSIRLGGPLYVEVGKTAELSLDFPPAMNIESKVWMSSDETKATVNEDGIVTGVAHSYNQYTHQYNPVTITCLVNGNITLTHPIDVAVPQPRQIRFAVCGDDVGTITTKVDVPINLSGTILPDEVDDELFRVTYAYDPEYGWVDFSTGVIKNPGSPGLKYVDATVRNDNEGYYLKTSVSRKLYINVEPYYVETMKFAQENVSLAPGQTSNISPILTSDVDGKQPTYRDMTWTSSNPQVASVDAETGLITTHTEGNTVITATITPAAVPSGEEPLSASFTLIVETPVDPINIGDFFYSDGTWSTERDYAKTVIGIIFSNTPASADSKLMTEYSQATHGLVVGIKEYNHHIGYLSNVGGSSDSGVVLKDRCDIFNEGVSNGYTNTYHLSNYSNEKGVVSGYNLDNGASVYYAELFHPTMGVLADVTTARPQGVSTWYIPSYNEMFLMKTNLDKINSSLTAAGGDALSGVYWTSTFKQYYTWNGAQGSLDATAGYNMENGSWKTYVTSAYKQTNPVRVVFAF